MLHQLAFTYTYTTTTSSGPFPWGAFLPIFIIVLVLAIIVIVGQWKVFQKAGRPGWAAIIPIYNLWVLFEIVGYPGWWAVLSIIPIVNIFPSIMSLIADFKLAKLFGKSDLFGVMTVLFPWVCVPILGFGNATFQGGGRDNQSFGPPTSPDDQGPSGPGGNYTPPTSSPPTPTAPPTSTPPTTQ